MQACAHSLSWGVRDKEPRGVGKGGGWGVGGGGGQVCGTFTILSAPSVLYKFAGQYRTAWLWSGPQGGGLPVGARGR